jgi:hypothetical protein
LYLLLGVAFDSLESHIDLDLIDFKSTTYRALHRKISNIYTRSLEVHKTMPSKGDSLLDLELLKNGIVDGGLIGQMHDLDKKVSLSKNILESLPERMKEAKSRFVSAKEDHKKFCAHAAEAAKSCPSDRHV